MMTYDEALERIHSFNVFGSRLGLERMEKLLSLLGNPHEKLRIIHVAGTNGKGSVCRYVYSVLTEAGYKAGAYFSPYVERFTERIEFAGEEISGEELAFYTERVLESVGRMLTEGFESPTEFELVTAIGLSYFAEKEADFVILEVGLGGSGDSTNISKKPIVTAITSISYDHMAQLGNTLELIAADKAGIIKEGVPVVVFVKDKGAFDVIKRKADELGAPLIDASEAKLGAVTEKLNDYSFSAAFNIAGTERSYPDVRLSMNGLHQVENAVCALHMIEVIRDAGAVIPREALYAGMRKAVQPGRFEVMQYGIAQNEQAGADAENEIKRPYLILDGAHNADGVKTLVRTLSSHFPNGRLLLCVGILRDKEYEKMAAELCRLEADIIATSVPNPRSLPAEELAEAFMELSACRKGRGLVLTCGDYREAFAAARAAMRGGPAALYAINGGERFAEGPAGAGGNAGEPEYDAVVWAGSLYLIGAVKQLLRSENG